LVLTVTVSCLEKTPGIYCDTDRDCTRVDRPTCDTEHHSCYKPDADLGVDMQPDLPPMCRDDSVCPVALPVCGGGGQCSGCQLGNNTACATHHAATPLCGPSGACVECVSKDDCASKNQTCNLTTNACEACRAHGDCSTGVCKPGGACATAAEVVYVNNAPSSGCTPAGPGTRAMPFCEIQAAALAAIAGSKPYVVVAGSATAYAAVSLSTATGPISGLTIIGPGRTATPTAKVSPSVVTNAFALSTVGNAATVVLDGLELIGQGSTSAGARCSFTSGAATLTIRNSLIRMSGAAGVDSNGCTLTLDGNTVSGNQGAGISTNGGTVTLDRNIIGPSNTGGGIVLGGTTSYTVTNNIIVSNGASAGLPGIAISSMSSSGTIAFNTISKNGGLNTVEGGVTCPSSGAGTKLIDSSIVVDNSTAAGTQFAGKCSLSNTVVGTGDATLLAGAIKQSPAFVSGTDFHLKANDAANTACCVDKIPTANAPSTPNADHDVDNTRRPKGAGWDYGAHEVQ
jgi:hypothetical protein